MGWTEDRVSVLKKLWLEGLSASQIAKQLGGVTRNAVIGKVHRLGLSGRATPSKPARTVFKAPRPARPVTSAPSAPPSPMDTVPTRDAARLLLIMFLCAVAVFLLFGVGMKWIEWTVGPIP